MIYGMYLSATGIITSAYRQDVIANNLANSETAGFKRDLATFAQRRTEDQENPMDAAIGNPLLDGIGGGTFASPAQMDPSAGTLEPTDNNLDVAIDGSGYFTVGSPDGKQFLTRAGQFRLDRDGNLTLGVGKYNPVLDTNGKPITLDPSQSIRFNSQGQILQNNNPVAQLGMVDVADPTLLRKAGGTLLSYSNPKGLTASQSTIQPGFLERSNVDPATELSDLMDTQRQLEANANMIRYQDETLGELVNTVGKVS